MSKSLEMLSDNLKKKMLFHCLDIRKHLQLDLYKIDKKELFLLQFRLF
jgi:hypothetical protein